MKAGCTPATVPTSGPPTPHGPQTLRGVDGRAGLLPPALGTAASSQGVSEALGYLWGDCLSSHAGQRWPPFIKGILKALKFTAKSLDLGVPVEVASLRAICWALLSEVLCQVKGEQREVLGGLILLKITPHTLNFNCTNTGCDFL